MIRKKTTLVFLCLCFILTGPGCAHNTDTDKPGQAAKEAGLIQGTDQVHLSILYSGTDVNWVAMIEQLAESFMAKNPQIILHMEPSDKGVYNEYLKAKEAMGEFPDLFEIQNPYSFAQSGILGTFPITVSNLVEEPVIFEGSVYALPTYSNTYGIVYNKQIFKAYDLDIPKTYQEFLNICEKLKAEGIMPLAVGGSKIEYMSYWLNYFYQLEIASDTPHWQSKRNIGEVSFTDPEPVNVMEKYQGLFRNYVKEGFMNMNDSQIVSTLVDCDAAMVYTGPWMFSQIVDAYPDAVISDKDSLGDANKELHEKEVTFQLGWFFMPDETGDKTPAINAVESNWALSKNCQADERKYQAAALFLEYFYEVANYREIIQSMNALPTTVAAVLYPSETVQQDLLVAYRYADKSRHYLGDYETPEEFAVYLYKILEAVAVDQLKVSEAMQLLDKKWDDVTESYGEY